MAMLVDLTGRLLRAAAVAADRNTRFRLAAD